MFIPISTDAPLYHRPWATVSLILLNCAALASVGIVESSVAGWEGWALEYGNGFHPLQWITYNFVHFGPFHLIGNMLFLWTFGLVVEGKIGWWRFLSVYLGIGIVGGIVIQSVMFDYDGMVQGAGGASLVVFGLIAVAMIWAPENEVDVLFLFFSFFYRASRLIQVRIYSLAGLYILMQLYILWNPPNPEYEFQTVSMSSEMAHLLGAFFGLGVGIVMLKQNWVDCENWDLFSVWKGEHRNTKKFVPWRERNNHSGSALSHYVDESNAEPIDPEVKRQQQEEQTEQINTCLSAGQPRDAFSAYQILKQSSPEYILDNTIHKALTNSLYKSRLWTKAVLLMEESVQRSPKQSDVMRVKLAGILVKINQRPRYALRILNEISSENLNQRLQRERAKIERVAQRMIDDGVMEFELPLE